MKSRLSAHFFFFSAIFLAQLQANDLLTTSEKTTYRVTITTSFQFPERTPYSQVEVAHPLPVKQSWSETSGNIARQPTGSQIRKIAGHNQVEISQVVWQKPIPSSGGNFSFTTTYETTSVTRSLPPEMARRARWNSRQVKANKTKDMNPEIVAMAKTLIKEPSPLEALSKFCAWLVTRVVYNANYETGSVDEILERGSGHCGQRAGVLLQFAQAVGLEMRSSPGLHLVEPDGGINNYLCRIKPIYGNIHAWVEVNIPGLGWIEIEPSHPNIFRIPHTFINTRSQPGSSVRLNKQGIWVKPTWQATEADPETAPEKVTTTYTSDVGLQTLVTFEILSQDKSTSSKSNSASPKVTPIRAPMRATLIESVNVPIVQNGKPIGAVQAHAGSIVQILKCTDDSVEISTRFGVTTTSSTNLLPIKDVTAEPSPTIPPSTPPVAPKGPQKKENQELRKLPGIPQKGCNQQIAESDSTEKPGSAGGPAPLPSSATPFTKPSSPAQPVSPASGHASPIQGMFWLTESGKRHNSTCRFYKKSKGKPCGSREGTPCGTCGG